MLDIEINSHSALGDAATLKETNEKGLYPAIPATLSELLDYYEVRRDQLIQDLRYIDRQLVKHGRLKRETIPRRIR